MEQEGRKADDGKPRWDLLPYDAVEEIVEVFGIGAKKYSDHNWQHLERPKLRYFAAGMRHFTRWFLGERNDPETGKSHLAHLGCCVLILLWHDKHEKRGLVPEKGDGA